MRTDRVNQFLVTVCVLVVLVTQFNKRETVVEHYDMTPRFSEDLEADNPALTEPKYGVFQRLFQRRKAPQNCFVQQKQPQPSTQPCPDGNCPVQPQQRPDCPDGTCPLVPTQGKSASALDKVKTGMVRCSCCGRVIVGNDLHTEWTDAGEPISPCCDECWHKMTSTQKKQSIEKWARSAGITDEAVLTRFKGVVQ